MAAVTRANKGGPYIKLENCQRWCQVELYEIADTQSFGAYQRQFDKADINVQP